MTERSSSLKDIIKKAQGGAGPVEIKEMVERSSDTIQNPGKKQESKKTRKEVIKDKPKDRNPLVEKMNSLEKLDNTAPMIHIRITPETHKKLLLFQMGEEKVSIQSLANYAITTLLEQKEMKELINKIKDGMV